MKSLQTLILQFLILSILYNTDLSNALEVMNNERNARTFDFVIELFEFRASNEKTKTLGIHLSFNTLKVKSFDANIKTGEMPWIHQVAGVEIGDMLLYIDDMDIKGQKIHSISKLIQTANTLTFRRSLNTNKVDSLRIHETQSKNLENSKDVHMNQLFVIRNRKILFSIQLSVAEFSAVNETWDCHPKRIEFLSPIDGCKMEDNLDYSEFRGALLFSRRGRCSFSKKGLNAMSMRAAGSIVINRDETIFKMPKDPLYMNSHLTIPFVMISKSSGERLLKLFDHSEIEGKLFGVIDLNSKCSDGDALFQNTLLNPLPDTQHHVHNMKKNRNHYDHMHAKDCNSLHKICPNIKAIHLQQTSHRALGKISSATIYHDKIHQNMKKYILSGEIHAVKSPYQNETYPRPMDFLVVDERQYLPINTNVSIHFVHAQKNCTIVKEIEENIPILSEIVSIVEDEEHGHCTYEDQIKLSQRYNFQIVILFPGPQDEFASDVLMKVGLTIMGKENHRWSMKESDMYKKSQKKEFVDNEKLNVGIGIISMHKEDLLWIRKELEEENSLHQKQKWKVVSNKHVDEFWSKIHSLSIASNWPRDARQRKRLMLKFKKGLRHIDIIRERALFNSYLKAESYFNS